MEIKTHMYIGGRRPGHVILNALRTAVEERRYQRRWVLDVRENHEVYILCLRKKGKRMVVIPDVQIKLLEPIIPEDMFSRVIAELKVTGLIKIMSARQIITDFEAMEREFKKSFIGQPRSYRAFDNQGK